MVTFSSAEQKVRRREDEGGRRKKESGPWLSKGAQERTATKDSSGDQGTDGHSRRLVGILAGQTTRGNDHTATEVINCCSGSLSPLRHTFKEKESEGSSLGLCPILTANKVVRKREDVRSDKMDKI